MRSPHPGAQTRAMEATEERTRVVLELSKGEPVEGSLMAGDGPARNFSGWMELVAALQSVLEEAVPPPDGRDADPLSVEQ
jgi:hypothetical protein